MNTSRISILQKFSWNIQTLGCAIFSYFPFFLLQVVWNVSIFPIMFLIYFSICLAIIIKQSLLITFIKELSYHTYSTFYLLPIITWFPYYIYMQALYILLFHLLFSPFCYRLVLCIAWRTLIWLLHCFS